MGKKELVVHFCVVVRTVYTRCNMENWGQGNRYFCIGNLIGWISCSPRESTELFRENGRVTRGKLSAICSCLINISPSVSLRMDSRPSTEKKSGERETEDCPDGEAIGVGKGLAQREPLCRLPNSVCPLSASYKPKKYFFLFYGQMADFIEANFFTVQTHRVPATCLLVWAHLNRQ